MSNPVALEMSSQVLSYESLRSKLAEEDIPEYPDLQLKSVLRELLGKVQRLIQKIPVLPFEAFDFTSCKDERAGMAALIIQNNETLDCPGMYRHVTERLPSYACPKFIRVKEAMEVTGTFKLRKVNLIKEGFDPRRISDPLYYMNEKGKTYSILDVDSFNGIRSGTIRL